ncbi:MAG: zinc-dependent alcohol dehydrogenase family protein [Candidatus Bipolaricaulia bacterium]
MKTQAAVLYKLKQSQPYAQSKPLVLEEVELEGPGSGEVLIEVVAAGLCHSDLSVIDGSRPRPVPMVLGHEASGIVREVGAGVSDLKPGDHVVFSFVPSCGRCVFCAIGRPALCEPGNRANIQGTLLSGQRRFKNANNQELHHHLGVSAFARYTVAAQESLIKIDEKLPLEKVVVFGCAVLTGVGAVFNTATVQPGESVAVFGLGGVGLSAILGAVVAGAHPIIAVDVLDPKLNLAKQVGATHTINAHKEDPIGAIKELTGGGAHYTFEAVGSPQVLAQAYNATRRGGVCVTMGLPHPDLKVELSAVSLVVEEKTLKGSYMGSAVPRRDLPRFLELYRAGKLPVERLISHEIQLSQINEGFDALAKGEAVRQVVRF